MTEPLFLTPNERHAVSLCQAHDEARLLAGDAVWETLPACSWSTFLENLWEERLLAHRGAQRLPSLLNSWQERFLWIRVLADSPQGENLLNPAAAGKLAADAWTIACEFELMDLLRKPHSLWNDETNAFLGWTEDFLAICRREHWLDSSRLEAALTDSLRDGSIPREALPSSLTLVGFADLTPAQRRLLEACGSLGVTVVQQPDEPPATPSHWCRIVAKDSEDELVTAARWIRRILEDTPNGTAAPRIGLVIPDLASMRSSVTRVLDEVLQPGQLLPGRESEDSVYNLSLGLPLAGWPVVADALSLLSLDGRWQPLPDLGVLFHSPFLSGAESETASRALLEARLLRDGAYQVTLSRVMKKAASTDLEGAPRPITSPVLAELLNQVLLRLNTTDTKLPPSAWAREFKELLELYGWPGERALDSSEYQTVQRWTELLAGLGSLDRVEPSLSRRDAVLALRRMAEETVYQPQLASGPVEVLGYLEAAGLPFDHLWLVGMHDGAWPRAARPNPYLPNEMQREHRVPHSSADRELEFARRLTRQLLDGAPHGVVSCASQAGDQNLRPSLLVDHLAERSLRDISLSDGESMHFSIFASRQLERVTDPGPPPVAPGRVSGGGTSIFKLQSACAFRAFSTLRLHARPLEGVDGGLDAMQRGKLLHTVLEVFWGRVRDSRALREWPAERIDEAISEAVEAALLAGKRERPDVLSGAFLELERQRLSALARDWLALEAERPHFKVRDTERVVEFEFGGVHLRAIVDRIDVLDDGSLAVIDYKTGSVHYNDWIGERPVEPQMPLYLVSSTEPIAALVYGRVRTGEMSFKGIGNRADVLPGVDHSEQAGKLGMPWADRIEEWRSVLTDLAGQFHGGHSAVEPLSRAKSCANCNLETLCRVDELELNR